MDGALSDRPSSDFAVDIYLVWNHESSIGKADALADGNAFGIPCGYRACPYGCYSRRNDFMGSIL